MATNREWYYSKNNEQFGPITAAELKQLAVTGQLSADDFIWNEQWPDWRAAGTIKGVFPEPKTKSFPPPLPPAASSQQMSANVSDAVKSDLSDFVSSAKKVKDLAVAHTRRTQITQMSLPKAYLALGKDVFANERFRDEFSDLYHQIAAKNDEIAKVSATTKERPQATDFKGKLQSGAANLMAQGQSAKLGFQRDTLIRELGRKAFETHGETAGLPELISPITSANEAVEKLDTQINASPTTESVPMWQRVPLAALLTVSFFPVGLYLVWHNPRLSRRTKAMWIGGFAAFIFCIGIFAQVSARRAREELANANQHWASGDKQAAISKYRGLTRHLSFISESDRSLVLGRLIDSDADSGNELAVQELLKKADEEHIVPMVSSEKARLLIANHLSERKKAEAAKQEKQSEDKSSTIHPAIDTPSVARTGGLKVSKGWGKGSFTLELAPDVEEEIEVSEASLGRSGEVSVKIHWKGSVGGRRNPWSYSVYDSGETQLEGGILNLPGTVSLGSRFKVEMIVSLKDIPNVNRIVIHR